MIPFYAYDAHTTFLGGNRKIQDLAEIVSEHAVVFQENGDHDGDAPYFVSTAPLLQDPHTVGHYMWYGGMWYGGLNCPGIAGDSIL